MSRWYLLSLASLAAPLMFSCAPHAPSAREDRESAPTAALAAPIDLGELDDDVTPADLDAPSDASAAPELVSVPSGTFANIDALCKAQTSLIRATLALAQARLEEFGQQEVVEPRCERAPSVLDGVTVRLRAPFLELAALTVETGYATEVHLAFRTDEGWSAVPHASVTTFHDDPGCFSIERDAGITSITVAEDSLSLEIVETSARGATLDYTEQDGTDAVETVDYVTERAVTCEVRAGAIACARPSLVSVARVPRSS